MVDYKDRYLVLEEKAPDYLNTIEELRKGNFGLQGIIDKQEKRINKLNARIRVMEGE